MSTLPAIPADLHGRVALSVGEMRDLLGIGRLSARRLAKQIGTKIGARRIVIPIEKVERLLRGELAGVSITTDITRVISANEPKAD